MPEVVYLDAAASTPLAPDALVATVDALKHVGNPGAAHAAGFEAARIIDTARQAIADLLDVGPASVVFTSSATEANNLVTRGVDAGNRRRGIVTTTTEHPSVLATLADLMTSGRVIHAVHVAPTGEINLDELSAVLSPETLLVSVHVANNETGVIQPIEEIVAMAHAVGAFVHADASQLMAWGPAPMLRDCDFVTISAHKMYGPQGAAALIVKPAARKFLRAQITGGGQENGLRGGTLNVAAIAGFGAAAALARASGSEAAFATTVLRARLLDGLVARIGDVLEHGASTVRRLPGILNVAIGASDPDSVESDALLARLPNLAASTGSACHAGATGPSRVLRAMGISEWQAARAIRLSLSRYTTAQEVDEAVSTLSGAYSDLGRLLWGASFKERFVR